MNLDTFKSWLNWSKSNPIASIVVGAALLASGVYFYMGGQSPLPEQPAVVVGDAPPRQLMGWAGPEAAEKAWAKYGHLFPKFSIRDPQQDSEGKIAKLWLAVEKATGKKYLVHNKQEIGDCVSFGAENGLEYLQCTQIGLLGQRAEFKRIFPCYHYACGRNGPYAGNGQMGRDPDGSTGTWQAVALTQDGAVPRDTAGIPEYSAAVARQWAVRMPEAQWLDIGRKHKLKTAARLYSYAEVRDAIVNTYPCTVASNQGFQMRGRSDGGKLWGVPAGSWAHQMCFIGVDDTVECPSWAGGGKGASYCMNNWGEDAHGAPVDDAPPGGFWVSSRIVDRMCKNGHEVFAYSGFDGFPGQKLDWSDLDLLDRQRAMLQQQKEKVDGSAHLFLAP